MHKVYDNKAAFGGGIFVIMDTSSMSIKYGNISNSSIRLNDASQGGGAFVSGAYLILQTSLMAENNAGFPLALSLSPSGFGGAVYLENSTVIIRNCFLLSNKAGSGGAVSVQKSSILNFTGDSNAIDTNLATNGGAAQV